MTSILRQRLTGPIAAGVAFFALGIHSAYADFFGGDIPLLTTLVGNTTTQIKQISDTLSTLRQTYDQAKRLAGYADDAYKAYQHFASYSMERFGQDVQGTLDHSFPDLSYFRQQASGTGPWAQGTGELQRLATYCFGGGSCVQLQEALSLNQARSAISQTFGAVPQGPGATEVNAVDHEAAVAMAASSSLVQRNTVARNDADQLLKECTDSGGESSSAACQAAANAAQIRQLRQGADLADGIAESNRLQAVALSQENARRKRELAEAAQRQNVIAEGTATLGAPSVEVKTEGLDVFGGAP